jgi:hypothetical protein
MTKGKCMRLVRLLFALLFAITSSLFAQGVNPLPQKPSSPSDSAGMPMGSETYGTSSLTWMSLTAWDFHPASSNSNYAHTIVGRNGFYCTGPGDCSFEAPLHLPEGAIVSALELTGCDTNANNDLSVTFVGTLKGGLYQSTPGVASTSGNSGCQTVSAAPFSWVVNNDTTSYTVEAHFLPVLDSTLVLSSVRVGYKLQISPDPATATFTDVPVGHPFHRFVEALVAAGITGGCGGGNYCPDAPVTRGQMAVFLSAALGLHWAP